METKDLVSGVRRAVGGWYPADKRMSVPERRAWIMAYLRAVESSVDCHNIPFVDMYFDVTKAPAEACLGVDLRYLVAEGKLKKASRPTGNARHPYHVRSYFIPEADIK